MDRAEVLRTIRAAEPALKAGGVSHLWLFGSFARGEAGEESDVDLMFDEAVQPFTLLDYAGLRRVAEETIPFKVDLLHRASLRPAIRERAEAEAVQVF